MKLKIHLMLFILLFSFSLSFAQNAPIDFESGGYGAGWTWTVFENETNPAVEIIDNPVSGGINTSAKVAKFTALQAGQPWAGCETQHGADIGTFSLTEDNCIIKIMVYKSVISDVGIKIATNTNWSAGEIKVPNTLVNEWEELSFDFSSQLTPGDGSYDQIIVFPDFNLDGRSQDNIVYFDNITFSAKPQGPTEPEVAAPTPDEDAADVVSLFSNAYTNVAVDTWSADWDVADVADVQVEGNDTKLYTNLVYAGIEFTSQTVDASEMTHFHMDIWTPDPTAEPAVFKVKLVDFGADGAYGGGDDVEHELTFTAATDPALATGQWVSLDVPMSRFAGLTTKGHLAQMIISGDPNTVYVDNIYFYKGEVVLTEPDVAAPTPDEDAADVVSLFSNAYTNVTVDTWSADWDMADVADVQIEGNDTKLYTNLVYAGIEFTSQPVDASEMTHFHMDIWTPDPTADPAAFRVKLVDFGADGAYGGGDDVEHELAFTAATDPALAKGQWVSLDVPLSRFAGLTTQGHLAQMIISGDPNTVYVDNIYFYKGEVVLTEPEVAAPTPDKDAADVVSLFSNAYTNVTVDTWSADWDMADVADMQIEGNDTKLYTNLVYAGIEFTSQPVDASEMTHFHMDIWTPDPIAEPAAFKVKLVDFGADGAYGGGDDVEHELTFTAATDPALATGQWVSLDVPLSSFTGLTTKGHLAQMIISGDPNTVYVDNIYFYRTVTSVNESLIPASFTLKQNFPNPFNPETTIQFELPMANHVKLTIYNMLGREIYTLLNEYKDAGIYTVILNASALPSGTYFYAISAGDYKEVRKMVLIK